MMPHLAETCWRALGHSALVVETAWPKADPALVAADSITYAVQVNGKLRGDLPDGAGHGEGNGRKAGAGAGTACLRALDGKAPKKVIVVLDRIVNIVA